MTRSLGEEPAIEAALDRAARQMRLLLMLETTAEHARERYGATRLIVDRTARADSADIRALIGSDGLVDLWDIDPLLWDDANWAAMRYLPPGHVSIVHPLKRIQ